MEVSDIHEVSHWCPWKAMSQWARQREVRSRPTLLLEPDLLVVAEDAVSLPSPPLPPSPLLSEGRHPGRG